MFINLRSDLTKLNDAEIAKALELRWEEFEAARKESRSKLRLSARGPIRHHWAYRFLSLGCVSGRGCSLYLGHLWFGICSPEKLHLTMCEIRDLQVEVKKRWVKREAAT